MKKLILIAVLMIFGLGFSQSNNPVLEVEGQLVKATYFHENGKVQQVGYFKDGKLDGKWTSYDVDGSVKTIAEYKEGQKVGKWLYFSDSVCTSEVDFSNNQILAVRTINAIADKN
ncbi:membrane-binding protein [Flavobacterium sp.]|uniref:toxin-antitoxin system YwqK family antitoxin n=1 Tax=Flavobacterium sp. TaxID=239 RepID=UPI00261C018E|nr:membrane-binding protein [Flavobacterium sp.]